nr:MAG TPA: hypothetical protein [Caudoviricetes sp.]
MTIRRFLVEALKLKTVFEPMCQAAHHHKAWGNLRLLFAIAYSL